QSHDDDANTPLEDTLGAFDDLVKAGKVRAIGASNFTAPRLAEIAGIAAEALGWDAQRQREELHACATALRERHGVRLQTAAPAADSPLDASLMASKPVLT
ncbi:aldo/keto reductase, partial [Variovorax paradoxus]|uniref:aldo/keto reductase n=1 Tax=Variovorax paradoxus TaxID=34073 RepID=UPI001ABBEE6D